MSGRDFAPVEDVNSQTLRVWNLLDGSVSLQPFARVRQGVTHAAFSRDGSHFAIVLDPNPPSVLIWDAGSNRARTALLPSPSPATSLAFSPDGNRLALGFR